MPSVAYKVYLREVQLITSLALFTSVWIPFAGCNVQFRYYSLWCFWLAVREDISDWATKETNLIAFESLSNTLPLCYCNTGQRGKRSGSAHGQSEWSSVELEGLWTNTSCPVLPMLGTEVMFLLGTSAKVSVFSFPLCHRSMGMLWMWCVFFPFHPEHSVIAGVQKSVIVGLI